MNRILLIIAFILLIIYTETKKGNCNPVSSGCSVAGTASLLKDSICNQDTATLMLTGYIGAIQWQHYDGTNWVNETGTGATSDTFSVMPGITTQYRALVTQTGCLPDSSNIITITVGVLSVPAGTGDTRCGYGQVNLQASGAPGFNWYNVPSGGIPIGSGPIFSPIVSSTTTYYVEALTGGGTASPLTTTYAGGNGFNGNMFDIEAINQVNISSFDCNCNAGTNRAEIWYRAGTYVGHEFDSAGWTFVGYDTITSAGAGSPTPVGININITIPAGQTYAFYFHFYGGVTYSNGTGVGNVAAQDANVIIREGAGGDYFNLPNFPRIWNGTLHYTAGCSSPRIPVEATVTFSEPVVITALDTTLCMGDFTQFYASSNNSSYAFTWTPATGLNTTTGDTVIAAPTVPTTYYLIGDNGTCANIDSVFLDVGPPSVAGTASFATDSICANDTMTISLSGYTGHIQWQSNSGAGWVNETNAGNNTFAYLIQPTANIQYRAEVTSGGCAAAISNVLALTVLTVPDPSVTDTSGCANDSISLNASGSNIVWFMNDSTGSYFAEGNNVNVFVTNDHTFYAASKIGSTNHVGPVNNAGGVNQSIDPDYGISFDVTRICTLEKVYVYPFATDTFIINLRSLLNGPIIYTDTVILTATGTKVPVLLGWKINPGVNYRLELAAGSGALKYNYSGSFLYPYTSGSCPLSITGSLTPFITTTPVYYYFYDFVVFEGCYSSRIPLHVTTTPAQPTIMQNGTVLTSSASTGNQWYWNGALIAGQTGQTLVISQIGLYSVHVTENGCTAIAEINVTAIGMNELKNADMHIYPNPAHDKIFVHFEKTSRDIANIRLINVAGEVLYQRKYLKNITDLEVNTSRFDSGSYLLEILTDTGVYRKTIIKQ